jgi:peroxiredoxin
MNVHLRMAAVAATVLFTLPMYTRRTVASTQTFGDEPSRDLVVSAFRDAEVGGFLNALDAKVAAPAGRTERGDDLSGVMAEFSRRLQSGRLSAAQEAQVLDHLAAVARARPDQLTAIEGARHVVRTLTVGKAAPEVSGRDLDGAAMTLSQYRGKVVALVFSGDWCGICRAEYPYEHFLLDLYKDWPFAFLTVNSDADAATAKRAYAAKGLSLSSWFDGDGHGGPRGPIASAWNVTGWPTSYLIDGAGVIRFVNLRHEDLLKGVRQLLLEQAETASRRK